MGRMLLLLLSLGCFAHVCSCLDQLAALLAMYDSAGGSMWNTKWDTNSTDYCSFYGVICDGTPTTNGTRNVVDLVLVGNGLTGVLDPSIGDLPALQYLVLSGNRLGGTLPTTIGRLSQLVELVMPGNRFSGVLPNVFHNLTNLVVFDARGNWLTGPFPPSSMANCVSLRFIVLQSCGFTSLTSALGALRSMLVLEMIGNGLSGTIPTELGLASSLAELILVNNRLSGPVPSTLGNLKSLRNLYLINNRLEGQLPSEMGQCTSLRNFHVENNQITGTLPSQLGALSRLEALACSNNQISGTFPPSFGNLSSLLTLAVVNAQISGSIPSSFSGLALLRNFIVPRNKLTGTLPALGGLRALELLYLQENQISGSIPSDIGNCTQLQHGNFTLNRFSGQLPTEIGLLRRATSLLFKLLDPGLGGSLPTQLGNLSSVVQLGFSDCPLLGGTLPTQLGALPRLSSLQFSNVSISGTIPSELSKPPLTFLDLSMSGLTGTLPTELANVATLERMWLDRAYISGTLPTFLGNMSSLTDLWIGPAKLSGTIPTELGNSKIRNLRLFTNDLCGTLPSQLGRLDLLTLWVEENRLSGTIPTQLGRCRNMLNLHIAGNKLRGTVPTQLGNMTQLWDLRIFDNSLSGTLPSELKRAHASLKIFRANDNQFTGVVPSWVHELRILERLALDNNKLHGTVPRSIGNMTKLQLLGLSQNALSGTLPSQMGLMTSLQTLDVLDNDLSGQLPTTLANLRSLVYLVLESNRFNGTLPAFSNMPNIREMNFRLNRLTGTLPDAMGTLASLQELDLSDNMLSGTIPSSFKGLASLSGLNIADNKFTSPLPKALWHMFELQRFIAPRNLFNEPLQDFLWPLIRTGEDFTGICDGLWVSPLSKLNILVLSQNNLRGTMPPEIFYLAQLSILSLEGNPEIGGQLPRLDPLSHLCAGRAVPRPQWAAVDLTGTAVEKHLPESWGKLSRLASLRVGDTKLRMQEGVNKTLPDFVRRTGSYVALTEIHSSCPVLSGQNHPIAIVLDPIYYNYTHCFCQTGYFGINGSCSSCPFGGECRGGRNIYVLPGFWTDQGLFDSTGRLSFHRCPIGYCCDSNEPCKMAHTTGAETPLGYEPDSACAGNRWGYLCGACKEGTSEVFGAQGCSSEGQHCHGYRWITPLIIIGCGIFVGILTLTFRYDFYKATVSSSAPEQGWLVEHTIVWNTRRRSALLKIATYFFQTMMLIVTPLTLKHQEEAFAVITGIFDLNGNQGTSVNGFCIIPGLTAVGKVFTGFAVPICLAVWIVIFTIVTAIRKYFLKHEVSFAANVASAFTANSIGYSSVLKATFTLVLCVDINDESRLLIDGNVVCYTDWQKAMFVCLVILLGYPIVLIILTNRLRKNDPWVGNASIPVPGKSMGEYEWAIMWVVGAPFRKGAVYWEAMLMFRRLVLIIIFTFVKPQYPSLGAWAMCVACAVVLLSNVAVHPYQCVQTHFLETCLLFILVIVSAFEIISALFEKKGLTLLDSDKTEFNAAAIILGIFVWVPLCIFGIAAFYLFVWSKRARLIAKLRKEPEHVPRLLLEPEERLQHDLAALDKKRANLQRQLDDAARNNGVTRAPSRVDPAAGDVELAPRPAAGFLNQLRGALRAESLSKKEWEARDKADIAAAAADQDRDLEHFPRRASTNGEAQDRAVVHSVPLAALAGIPPPLPISPTQEPVSMPVAKPIVAVPQEAERVEDTWALTPPKPSRFPPDNMDVPAEWISHSNLSNHGRLSPPLPPAAHPLEPHESPQRLPPLTMPPMPASDNDVPLALPLSTPPEHLRSPFHHTPSDTSPFLPPTLSSPEPAPSIWRTTYL